MVLNTKSCYTRNPQAADARLIERLIKDTLDNSWSTLPPISVEVDWKRELDPLVEIDSRWDAIAA